MKINQESRLVVEKDEIIRKVQTLVQDSKMRFLFLFASDERRERGNFCLRYLFSYPQQDRFLTLEVDISEKAPSFPSVTPLLPQADWMEREIQDLYGLVPQGHPDPRRLVLHGKEGEYSFDRVEGEGVFEIPVGPVHAGIIEPGHFRFSSAGESILKLEIRHFYTHKGIEKLGEGKSADHLLCLAERISGDNSLAHATACAQGLEDLCGLSAPPRAHLLRVIFLEMERIYNHLGDISGMSMDVAFGFGAAQLARIKEQMMRLNERLTGSRLLRSVVIVGGVRRDISKDQQAFLLNELKRIKQDFDSVIQFLWSVSSLMDRIQGTGVITKEIAEVLGAVGPVARASGIDRDLRREHSYAAYQNLFFMVPVFPEGDVESRMKVRVQEIYESFKLIQEAVEALPQTPCRVPAGDLPPNQSALGYVESPRGSCFHWIQTDSKGKIARWKIQSPSFTNWRLIEYAVLGNIVPDFPLINKSMNLSYSGNDR
ncbi:MAG: NADH-quinone oxidoreductase subunit C [Candidatus Omnitrophica bacterium]|nr:NADH-quinone oxidoreductase subunit C [Candidatus Omnitrophota bacterium]